MRRDLRRRVRLTRGEHTLPVDGGEVGHPRTGTGRDDHEVGLDLDAPVAAVRRGDLHRVRVEEAAGSCDHPDVLGTQQCLERLPEAPLDRGDPLAQRVDVEPAPGGEAHRAGVGEL